uniref:hypothetical protein n=1 Tax=Rhodococcus qingshengii TaxID=334542 RepID=UPI003558D7CD
MKASATRIARSVLSDYVDLRADGLRVAMHVLMVAREQMTCERTRAINALTALVRTVEFGVDARKSLSCSQITAIMTWRTRSEDATAATCQAEAVRLAKRIRALDAEFVTIESLSAHWSRPVRRNFAAVVGAGTVVAASVLIAWSHAGRVRSKGRIRLARRDLLDPGFIR